MKKKFTKEFLNKNCGCWNWGQHRIKMYYEKTGTPYTDDYIVSLSEIISLDMSMKHKIWFLFNSCELTESESNFLTTNMQNIVLPIFKNKYPDLELNHENMELANKDNNDDACHACHSFISKHNIDSCIHAAVAATYCEDAKYLDQLTDFLKEFINNN